MGRIKAVHFELSSEAANDVKKETRYYEKQKKGLGKEFVSRLRETIHHLQKNPFLYKKEYLGIRRISLEQFPFTLFYFIEKGEEKGAIIAVVHKKRNPSFWKKRVRHFKPSQ